MMSYFHIAAKQKDNTDWNISLIKVLDEKWLEKKQPNNKKDHKSWRDSFTYEKINIDWKERINELKFEWKIFSQFIQFNLWFTWN